MGWVMRLLLFALTLSLAGCDQGSEALVTGQSDEVARLRLDVASLQAEIRSIKDDAEAERKYVRLVSASLDEARQNHTALLKTVNFNADKANKRADLYHTRMGDCGKEWVQGDQGWVTVNADCSKTQKAGR